MLKKFDKLFNKIISEELNQTDQLIIDKMIKKLDTLKHNKDLTTLNRDKVQEIFNKINHIESFGKIKFTEDELKDEEKRKAKIKREQIKSYLLNSLEHHGVKFTKGLIDALKATHHKNLIQIPDVNSFKRNTLYVFDRNSNNYIAWPKDTPLRNYLIPIQGNKDYLKKIFNATHLIDGDISGKGELLAEHLFGNYEFLMTYNERSINNSIFKSDGKILNTNIFVDVKHTLKLLNGIHNVDKHLNSNKEFSDDHNRNLKANVLYLVFDFRSNNVSYALVYYHHKQN